MDMSMLWRLCWVDKVWFKVVGKTSTWQTLEIVKINNASYYHIIVIQGLSKLFLKAQLNFELEYLQYCIMANDSWDSLDDIKTWHLYMTFHYVYFHNFELGDYHCPYLPQSILIFLVVLILDMMMEGAKIVMILGA